MPATVQPGSGGANEPRLKNAAAARHRTLLGVPIASRTQRTPAEEVSGAPVLPVGTLDPEQERGQPERQRETYKRPAPAYRNAQAQESAASARRRDEPKTSPAVPVEAYEAPRTARQAVVRHSTPHPPSPRPGIFTGEPGRPSRLPTLPPLRQSIASLAVGKIGNATLIGIVAAAAMVVIAAELYRSHSLNLDTEFPIDSDDNSKPSAATAMPSEAEATPSETAESEAPPAGRATRIETHPPGAEIVYHGAVIANTPAVVPQPPSEADYLLRKPGYQPQLVRLSGRSPQLIRLDLERNNITEPDTGPASSALPNPVNTRQPTSQSSTTDVSQEAAQDPPRSPEEPNTDTEGAAQPPKGRSGLPILPLR